MAEFIFAGNFILKKSEIKHINLVQQENVFKVFCYANNMNYLLYASVKQNHCVEFMSHLAYSLDLKWDTDRLIVFLKQYPSIETAVVDAANDDDDDDDANDEDHGDSIPFTGTKQELDNELDNMRRARNTFYREQLFAIH